MHILHGWPPATDDHTLQPYSLKQNELSIMDGCVLWGNRVVIPTAGRQQILEELHESHQGASRMKGRARMVVWWPNLDRDIEQLVSITVQLANHPDHYHQLLHCTHGLGQTGHGQDCTSIMRGQ